MESAVSYLKCLSSYIEDDKYTNLIQKIDNAALEYEEAITNSDTSASLFTKYESLYSLLNEHITNLDRYFKNFDTDEFIKNELVIDDKINEDVLQRLEKEIIKAYMYEKHLLDYYGTTSLYTKITKSELIKHGINYDNLLPQIKLNDNEDKLIPVENEITIYVYPNGVISEERDQSLSKFSFKVLKDTSGFDWNAKGYDVNMNINCKDKFLTEGNEGNAESVLIENVTDDEKLLKEILSEIQNDDYELNLELFLDEENNAYLGDFNLLFFILCFLVNFIRENTDDESADDSLEIIENKIKRVKKDIKDKLSKFGIENIKGVFLSADVPKVFDVPTREMGELSLIINKNESEKKDIYHSVLGEVLDPSFQLLLDSEENGLFVNSHYKKLEVGISDFASVDLNCAVKKTLGKKEINHHKNDIDNIDNIDNTEGVNVQKTQSEIEEKSDNKEIKIPEKILKREEDASADKGSEQSEDTNSEGDEKEDKKLTATKIAAITVGGLFGLGVLGLGIYLLLKLGRKAPDNEIEEDSELMSSSVYNEACHDLRLDKKYVETNLRDGSGNSKSLTMFGVTVNTTLDIESLMRLDSKIKDVDKPDYKSDSALCSEQKEFIIQYLEYKKKCNGADSFIKPRYSKSNKKMANIMYAYMYSENEKILHYSDLYAKYEFGFNEDEIKRLKELANEWKKADEEYTFLCLTFHNKEEDNPINYVFDFERGQDPASGVKIYPLLEYHGYYSISELPLDSWRDEQVADWGYENDNPKKLFYNCKKSSDSTLMKSYKNGLSFLPMFECFDNLKDVKNISKRRFLGFSPLFFSESNSQDVYFKDDNEHIAKKVIYFVSVLYKLNKFKESPELAPIASVFLPDDDQFLPYEERMLSTRQLKKMLRIAKIMEKKRRGARFYEPYVYYSYYKIFDVMKEKFFNMKEYKLPYGFLQDKDYGRKIDPNVSIPILEKSPTNTRSIELKNCKYSIYSRLSVFMSNLLADKFVPVRDAIELQVLNRFNEMNNMRSTSKNDISYKTLENLNDIYNDNIHANVNLQPIENPECNLSRIEQFSSSYEKSETSIISMEEPFEIPQEDYKEIVYVVDDDDSVFNYDLEYVHMLSDKSLKKFYQKILNDSTLSPEKKQWAFKKIFPYLENAGNEALEMNDIDLVLDDKRRKNINKVKDLLIEKAKAQLADDNYASIPDEMKSALNTGLKISKKPF